MILRVAGHAVTGDASTAAEAFRLAELTQPDLVFVDLSLADGVTGVEIGRSMVERFGAAVVFMTANARRIPDDYCGAIGVIEKPFARDDLLSAMRYLTARLVPAPGGLPTDRRPWPTKPKNLQLSPSFEMRWQETEAA
jgi:two-component system, response regulator PdtaR